MGHGGGMGVETMWQTSFKTKFKTKFKTRFKTKRGKRKVDVEGGMGANQVGNQV